MCADMRSRSAKKHGATEQKLFTLAAWHDGPYFSEAERAALALTEAATRLVDRADPVPQPDAQSMTVPRRPPVAQTAFGPMFIVVVEQFTPAAAGGLHPIRQFVQHGIPVHSRPISPCISARPSGREYSVARTWAFRPTSCARSLGTRSPPRLRPSGVARS